MIFADPDEEASVLAPEWLKVALTLPLLSENISWEVCVMKYLAFQQALFDDPETKFNEAFQDVDVLILPMFNEDPWSEEYRLAGCFDAFISRLVEYSARF